MTRTLVRSLDIKHSHSVGGEVSLVVACFRFVCPSNMEIVTDSFTYHTQVAINIWHVLYFLASVAMCGLGMYAAVQGFVFIYDPLSLIMLTSDYRMITAFENPQLNSFSCVSPLNLNAD